MVVTVEEQTAILICPESQPSSISSFQNIFGNSAKLSKNFTWSKIHSVTMPDWSLEEDVVLFAWLDFCNKHGVDHLATIEQKMMEGTGNRRTKSAARWRLQLIEWKYRKSDETRPLNRDEFDLVPNISQKGSKSLKYPPRGMARKIKNALSDYEKIYTSNETQKMVEVTPMKNNRGQLQVQVPSRKSSPVKTRIVPASKTSQQAQDEASHVRKRSSQEAGEEIARKKRRLEKVWEPLASTQSRSELLLATTHPSKFKMV
ncbi:hypothetical protein OCU04_003172 [Sclerotinia nivalis]|uniref:Uncharacterized protein n=1 Tax=Sclerotinia nivalis TaxID=352851 RepID=A0A9X0AV48_9HELO|nr:hypothetical protein OCU04_003172 [Sclerotinia nivalis]